MAGYDWNRCISNNAADCYDDGMVTKSKITSEALRAFDIKLSVKKASEYIEQNLWTSKELHRCGSKFMKVKFYNLEDLKTLLRNGIELKEVDKTEDVDIVVEGTFAIFHGKRFAGKRGFKGILAGNWIYLDDGKKKKAYSNYLDFDVVSKVSPEILNEINVKKVKSLQAL